MKRLVSYVAGAALIAGLVGGAATASAATENQRSTPRAAALTPAKSLQLQKVARADGQYTGLVRRIRSCRGSGPVLRSAAKQRTAAVKNLKRSSVPVLRKKHKSLSKTVQVLARFEAGCTRSSSGAVVTPNPQPTPGAAPGSLAFSLTTPAALNSPLIDLTPLLRGGVLPGTINLVTPGQLTSPTCALDGAACVAVDANGLIEQLRNLVAQVPLIGPIAAPLLDQVGELLAGGDLDALYEVRRISDTVIQLVPEGPLATLVGLLGDTVSDATGTVGTIQVV